MSTASFRRRIERYKADGLEGLLDKRLSQVSKRRAGSAQPLADYPRSAAVDFCVGR